MSLRPAEGAVVLVSGDYRLDATHASAGRMQHVFQLKIRIPDSFPASPPKVYEIGGNIPRKSDFHVNITDGSFCLGSPIGLKAILHDEPDLAGFLSACLRPFLYAALVKKEKGGAFVFGELRHFDAGILEDLASRLAIPERSVRYALSLLGKRKRIANKCPCPCGCGKRLGGCMTNAAVCRLRSVASRSWFKAQLDALD
jgi:hypothetical protein